MDRIYFLLCIGFVFACMFITVNQALTENIEQACYGNGFEDYLIPSCPSGEKIYIYDVFVYAKRKELNCPQTATYFDRNITFCCNYVNEKEDCGQRYFGTSSDFEHAHYSRCTGLTTCAGIQVAWNYTEHFCDVTRFSERTNYMKMWYNCIPDISSMSINSASVLTGNQVFLSSENYPALMSDCSVTSGATCSVYTSNGSPIRITALDLQFSETSGVCHQRIHITDMLTNVDISCRENNQFNKQEVYVSTDSSIEIRLDNTATTTAGKFWIQIEATEASERVTVECRDDPAIFKCGSSLSLTTQDMDTTTSSMYKTSAVMVTSLTDFFSSTDYKTFLDQRYADSLTSPYTKNIEYKTKTDTEMSTMDTKNTIKLSPTLSEYYKTNNQVLTTTYTSSLRGTSESLTIPIIEKSSLYLESSKTLDLQYISPISSEYFWKTSEVSTLTKDMFITSSETRKPSEFSTQIDTRTSRYLQSSLLDTRYFSPTSEHYKTTPEVITSLKDTLKTQIFQMSDSWTTIKMEKSSIYLDSSLDPRFISPTSSEYYKTTSDDFISTKEIVNSLSEIRNTSELITKLYTKTYASSIDLDSSSNIDSRYLSLTSLEFHQMTSKTLMSFKETLALSTKIRESTTEYKSSSPHTSYLSFPTEYSSDASRYFLSSSISKETHIDSISSKVMDSYISDRFVYSTSSDAQMSSTFKMSDETPSSVATSSAETDVKKTTAIPTLSSEITSSWDLSFQSADTLSQTLTSSDVYASSVYMTSSNIKSTISNDVSMIASFTSPSVSAAELSSTSSGLTMFIKPTSSLFATMSSSSSSSSSSPAFISSPVTKASASISSSVTMTPSSSFSLSSLLSSSEIASSVAIITLESSSFDVTSITSTSTSNTVASNFFSSASITTAPLTSGSSNLAVSSSNMMSLTPTLSVTDASTMSVSSDTTQASTTASSSNSSLTKQDPVSSEDSLDLSWIFTIFPAAIGAATVAGSIGYGLNRLRKKCIQVHDETPRRRIAFA